jgi:peptide/nickel transport system substrate-binding protein
VKKFLLIVVSFMIITCIITGCNSGTSTTASSPVVTKTSTPNATASPSVSSSNTAVPQPQYGGTLKIIIGFGFGTNIGNPVLSGNNAFTSFYAPPCGEALAQFDSTGNLVPVLAQSWELDSNAKTITFNLRKGVKFHDGTDFNAAAVKWNWDVRIARGGAITGGENIQSIEVIDDNTVKVTFKIFSALNLYSLTSTIFMYSPSAVKNNGDDWAKLHPIGTGPFKLVDAKIDAYVKYQRNDNYWGPKPYLDGIEFNVIPDNMVAQAMILAKQADMWAESVQAKDVQSVKDKGVSVATLQSLEYFMCPDSANANSPLANLKVRQAVQYALDKEALNKAFSLGYGSALYQCAPPNTISYLPDYQGQRYDPAKAKQLLTEAGYPTGFKTKMMVNTDQASRDMGTAIQNYLGAVGIDLALDPADNARYFDGLSNGWKEGFFYTPNGINPGLSFIQFLATYFNPRGKVTMARSAEFLDIYNKLMAVPDLSTVNTLGKQMNKALSDDVTALPLITNINARITQPYVHTNYLSIHARVWSPGLDWMEKH